MLWLKEYLLIVVFHASPKKVWQMMTNGISEILGVSSPPILPCFRATTCRQHACTLVTQHRTPWRCPTLIPALRSMGQGSEPPTRTRARIWPQRGKRCGAGRNRWVNQTCADSWSRVLFALRLRLYLPGRWASSQGLAGEGLYSQGDGMLPHQISVSQEHWAETQEAEHPETALAGLHQSQQLTPLSLYLRLYRVKVWASTRTHMVPQESPIHLIVFKIYACMSNDFGFFRTQNLLTCYSESVFLGCCEVDFPSCHFWDCKMSC